MRMKKNEEFCSCCLKVSGTLRRRHCPWENYGGQELTQCEYFKTSKSWSLVVEFSENFIGR